MGSSFLNILLNSINNVVVTFYKALFRKVENFFFKPDISIDTNIVVSP